MADNKYKISGFILIFLFFLSLPLWSLPYLGADLGLILLGNTEEESAPDPVIMQGLGVTFPVYQIEALTIEVSGLFYGTFYQWFNDRASPADIERADNLWVLTVQLDGKIAYAWPLGGGVDIGVVGGLSLAFRIPLFAYDNGEKYRKDMTAYFFDMARFLYPHLGSFLDWAIAEGLDLRFTIRCLLPIYDLWSGEDFWNGLMIQGLMSLNFKL
jgi:hypothetical protein